MSIAPPAESRKVLARDLTSGDPFGTAAIQIAKLAFPIVCVIVVLTAFAAMWNWAWEWPEDWILPVKQWLSDMFRWLDKEATFGLFTVKELTRTIAWVLKQPLARLRDCCQSHLQQ